MKRRWSTQIARLLECLCIILFSMVSATSAISCGQGLTLHNVKGGKPICCRSVLCPPGTQAIACLNDGDSAECASCGEGTFRNSDSNSTSMTECDSHETCSYKKGFKIWKNGTSTENTICVCDWTRGLESCDDKFENATKCRNTLCRRPPLIIDNGKAVCPLDPDDSFTTFSVDDRVLTKSAPSLNEPSENIPTIHVHEDTTAHFQYGKFLIPLGIAGVIIILILICLYCKKYRKRHNQYGNGETGRQSVDSSKSLLTEGPSKEIGNNNSIESKGLPESDDHKKAEENVVQSSNDSFIAGEDLVDLISDDESDIFIVVQGESQPPNNPQNGVIQPPSHNPQNGVNHDPPNNPQNGVHQPQHLQAFNPIMIGTFNFFQGKYTRDQSVT